MADNKYHRFDEDEVILEGTLQNQELECMSENNTNDESFIVLEQNQQENEQVKSFNTTEEVIQESKRKSKKYKDRNKEQSVKDIQPKHERHYPHGHFKVHLVLNKNQVIVPYNNGYVTLVGDFSHVKAGDEIDY